MLSVISHAALSLRLSCSWSLEPAGAEHDDRRAGAVDVGEGAGQRRARSARCRRPRGGDIGERLAVAVGVRARRARTRTGRSDCRSSRWPARRRTRRSVAYCSKSLQRCRRALTVAFELLRHARLDLDHGADRVAGIGRRERPVEHVDRGDLFRRDHPPFRRGVGVVVADQRREQHAVGIDQAARAGADAGRARGDRRLGVADMALAHEDVGKIAQRILGIDDVGGLCDFLGRAGLGTWSGCCSCDGRSPVTTTTSRCGSFRRRR